MTLSRAFAQGVSEEMERDDSIFVMGTDIYERGGHFAQVKGLGPTFGRERVRDTPISEAAMVAAGVGAAMSGMRPIVDLNFVEFAYGAMDEIVNQAAKMRYMAGMPVPLVIRATFGIALFAAQHNNSLEGWFAQTPGLIVVAPSTAADAKGLIKSALRAQDPVIFLMHKKLAGARGEIEEGAPLVPLGRGLIRRPGHSVTIVSYGATVNTSLRAAETLAATGIEAEVIDLRSLAPLDVTLVAESVRKTGRLVVVSDAPEVGGIAASLAADVQRDVFEYLDAPVERVLSIHTPIPHSPPLIDTIVPQPDGVVDAVRASLSRWPSTVDA